MKKVIVVSDSHGDVKAINRIFEEFEFDYFLYLGDGISDLGIYRYDERVKLVRGNNDFFSNEKDEYFLTIENVCIYMTHGDKLGVRYSLNRLYERVENCMVDLVLYGHTHKWADAQYGNVRFFNPGAISSSRGNGTFALLTIDNKKISIEKCSF